MFDTQKKYRLVNRFEQTILGSMFTFDSYAIVVDHVTEEDFILNLTAFCANYSRHGCAWCCD